MELNFILNFIDAVFLQMDFFGMREGPLGTDDPMIKGAILSMLAVAGFGIALNVINSGIRKKMVDQVKQRRITKEVRAWQKERMAAFRSKDQSRIASANKKSSYMNKMNMEMMQMNITTNDDYNYTINVNFLFCITTIIFIYCSTLTNSTKCYSR